MNTTDTDPFHTPTTSDKNLTTQTPTDSRVEHWDKVAAALSDIEFIEALAIAQGLPEMLKVYAKTVKLLQGEEERQTETTRQAELGRYAREMYQYAAAWTRIREGSGDAEPTLPRPVKSVRLWTVEEIAAERKRMTETPNRLDIVKAFRVFVATNAALLQQHCTQKGFAANLARNDAPAGPVHEEGERVLNPLKCIKFIKQFAPEEAYNPLPACTAILDGHTGPVNCLALSADGRLAVSGSDDKTLRVWNLESGECLQVLEGQGGFITTLALSADGRIAVSGSDDKKLRVWNLDSGEPPEVREGHTSPVTALALSADGRLAVSGASSDDTMLVWNLASDESPKALKGQTSSVTSIALSADGRFAVSGSYDTTLRVWNLETGEHHKVFEPHTRAVSCVALSADGRLAVSGSHDETLRVWNIDSHAPNANDPNDDDSRAIPWDDDDILLKGHTSQDPITDSIADEHLADSGGWDKTLRVSPRVWNLESGERLDALKGHEGYVTSLALSADGRIAVSGSRDKTLRVWNLESGECLKVLVGHTGYVTSLALSADGRFAVSGSNDKTLRVWNLESGDCTEGLAGQFTSLALSDDDGLAVSWREDGSLRVWNLDSGKSLKGNQAYADYTRPLDLSAEGSPADSERADETLRCWNLDSGECLKVHKEHMTDSVSYHAKSADEQLAVSWASSDKTLRIWKLKSRECLEVPEWPNAIGECQFECADGQLAVSGQSWDETLRVWNLNSRECLAKFPARGLQNIVFKSKRVVVSLSTGKVEFYNIENLPLAKP